MSTVSIVALLHVIVVACYCGIYGTEVEGTGRVLCCLLNQSEVEGKGTDVGENR